MSPSFEHVADEWIAWARTPGHDAYWYYRDAFFALLPPPAGPVLEVGCGEGRVTRDLAARGYAVTGMADAGGWEDGRYVLTRSYRHGGPFSVRDQRDGLGMTFAGHRHSIADYARALEAAGLVIEAIREPGPADGAPERYAPWDDIPMFLHVRATRPVDRDLR